MLRTLQTGLLVCLLVAVPQFSADRAVPSSPAHANPPPATSRLQGHRLRGRIDGRECFGGRGQQALHPRNYRRRRSDIRSRQRRPDGRSAGECHHHGRQRPRREINQPSLSQSRKHALRRHHAESRAGESRMGPGRLRRRLRQRWLRRSVRHLLRPQRSLSQRGQRNLQRCHRSGGTEIRRRPLGHGLLVLRLRPRRQARSGGHGIRRV